MSVCLSGSLPLYVILCIRCMFIDTWQINYLSLSLMVGPSSLTDLITHWPRSNWDV